MADYGAWKVSALKQELLKRNARISGRKNELIERLHAYDRNMGFLSTIRLQNSETPAELEWPEHLQLKSVRNTMVLPKLSETTLQLFYEGSPHCLVQGKAMCDNLFVLALSLGFYDNRYYMRGVCRAEMKGEVMYWLQIISEEYEIMQVHCECPAGSHLCKHTAAALYALIGICEGKETLAKSSTEDLQHWHCPKNIKRSPLKCESLAKKYPLPELHVEEGFSDYVRNLTVAFSNQHFPIIMGSAYEKECSAVSFEFHDYCKRPLKMEIIMNMLETSDPIELEKCTRGQRNSLTWQEERKWRITASNFYTIMHLTHRRDLNALCGMLFGKKAVKTQAMKHGIIYEKIALKQLEDAAGIKIIPCGLFTLNDYPGLGASPDGVVGEDAIVEVKAPFTSRKRPISSVSVPYLEDCNGKLSLKKEHPYYYQIQGGMYLSGRTRCYFGVYTFVDFFWEVIEVELFPVGAIMIPQVDSFFYDTYLSYLANELHNVECSHQHDRSVAVI